MAVLFPSSIFCEACIFKSVFTIQRYKILFKSLKLLKIRAESIIMDLLKTIY